MADRSQLLKQRLWRWHFLAGLVVCPFAILLSLSGSIYLFKPQIDNYEEASINALAPAVEQGSPSLPASSHVQTLLAEHPESNFKRIILAKPGDRSLEIELVNADSEKHIYWVDSISGQVLASKNSDKRLMQRVKKLHSELLLGNLGSYVVELMASWLIILVMTGLYLWLSKQDNRKAPKKLISPQVSQVAPEKRWRSLHAVVGFWVTVPIMLLLLSGLPWTQLWGAGFDRVKAMAGWQGPGQVWFVTLQSQRPAAEAVAIPESSLWEINSDPHAHHNSAVTGDVRSLDLSILDRIQGTPDVAAMIHPVQIAPPKPKNGVWTVRSMPAQRSARETIHFDQYSAQPIQRIGFKDHHPVEQLVSQGVSLHEGALFGWLNQLLGVLTALAITCISCFGLYAWWLRKPQGGLGIPETVDSPTSPGLLVGIVLLGVLLPAAGISFVLIYSVEWLAGRVRQA
ncbi:MAG: PepSY domain-containing protein [Porticoccaceae bacterium]|nr:PepSY domain-containing protein [Porticoccaceae bacterium]